MSSRSASAWNGKIRKQNEREITLAKQRDRSETQALIDRQIEDRRILQRQINQVRHLTASLMSELGRDIVRYREMGAEGVQSLREAF